MRPKRLWILNQAPSEAKYWSLGLSPRVESELLAYGDGEAPPNAIYPYIRTGGNKPADLPEYKELSVKAEVKQPDFENVVGQDSLTRFDARKNQNKNKHKKPQQNKGGNQPQNKKPNNPQNSGNKTEDKPLQNKPQGNKPNQNKPNTNKPNPNKNTNQNQNKGNNPNKNNNPNRTNNPNKPNTNKGPTNDNKPKDN